MIITYLYLVPGLVELQDALSEVRARWYDLGLRLGLTPGTLDAIKTTYHHVADDCMREMLRTWLQETSKKACWSDVVAALRAMKRNDVADKVVGKYCDSTSGLSLGMSVHCTCMVLLMYRCTIFTTSW